MKEDKPDFATYLTVSIHPTFSAFHDKTLEFCGLLGVEGSNACLRAASFGRTFGKVGEIYAITVVNISISTLPIGLRIYVRARIVRALVLDDRLYSASIAKLMVVCFDSHKFSLV